MQAEYSAPERHRVICKLADSALATLSEEKMIALCPDDYGSTLTDDHRLYLWNKAYDEYAELDDWDLYLQYSRIFGALKGESNAKH
jgi:hypothetical protein